MTPRRGLRVLAFLVPAVLLVPVAAHAEKVVTEDAVGDVQKANWAQEDVEVDPALVPAQEETSTDIVRTVVAHGDNRLTIAVHFRDLVRINDLSAFVRIHAPSRGAFDLGLDKVEGVRATVSLGTRSGDVECRGLRGSLDRAADLVAFSVPTACVDNPRWVRLGVGVIGTAWPADEQAPIDFDLFIDDGNRATLDTERLARGPRVRRG